MGTEEPKHPPLHTATEADPPQIVIEDVSDVDEAFESKAYRYGVTSYGADYPVDGLVQRINSGDIVIPTFDPPFTSESSGVAGFQRHFVWTRLQMDRFIESLLLGLPIPGIFLVREPNNTFLVLDGQQRLRTLQAFKEGVVHGKEFRLGPSVAAPYRGNRYQDLREEDRRQLDNTVIHATVVRQDEPSNDQSSIYLIFERLNTGGTQLQAQEIRVALVHVQRCGVRRGLS